MDKEIRRMYQVELANYQDDMKINNKEIKRLAKENEQIQKKIAKLKERAEKPCELNRSCHLWEMCWEDGKLKCGNCSSFETHDEYEKRMSKPYIGNPFSY